MTPLGRILVLGLGRSGAAAARYATSLLGSGEVSSVTVYDAADADPLRVIAEDLVSLGAHVLLGTSEVEGEYDLCIASPGIPPHAALMRSAMSASRRTISEIEFAFERSTQPWIAVTGTNGKTTTTALIAHLLEAADIPSAAVGNIGPPAIAQVESGEHVALVAEVSSFQLALTEKFHPKVAVLLNVTPDHVDWHGTLEAYAAAKARVFENLSSDDFAVIDVDDAGSAPYADTVAASGVQVMRVGRSSGGTGSAIVVDGVLTLETRGGPLRLLPVDELLIRGDHNVSNALAAAAAAFVFGASAARIAEGLRTFRPIEHRMEPAGTVDGVEWFNDSKATNPDAVFKALTAFGDTPLVVLLGGRNKGNDFRPLAEEVAAHAKAAVLFGESRPALAEAFRGLGFHTVEAVSMSDAVEAARTLAEPGDAVLLSPACASFDEFTSYEHRGRVFKEMVRAMAGGND